MNSRAVGPRVRFFRVMIPIDAQANDNFTGKILSSGYLVENRNPDVEKIVRNRPVASKLIRTCGVAATTATRG